MYEPIVIRSGPENHRDRSSRGLLLCDRDGVIIEDRPGFVRSAADVVLVPGAVEALVSAGEQGFPTVIVSNQSGIGRGILAVDEVVTLHLDLVAELRRAGAPILASFLCPHAPGEGCECRKPSPRMLAAAIAQYGARPQQSAFVGDAREDMTAAVRAGVVPVLVQTGRGGREAPFVRGDPGLVTVQLARDLGDAVNYLFRRLTPISHDIDKSVEKRQ